MIAVDGAGTPTCSKHGRNHMSFKIVKTPSNQGSATGTPASDHSGPTTIAVATPINDTGSPLRHELGGARRAPPRLRTDQPLTVFRVQSRCDDSTGSAPSPNVNCPVNGQPPDGHFVGASM